ncbi:MAG: B12-binding domain-containing radical SAM protein [Candidatus Helarchaeota archaeon]
MKSIEAYPLMPSFRVLLINPIRIRPPIGPIAFDYIGQSIQNAGYHVDLIDGAFSELKSAIMFYFKEHTPFAIGVTIRNTDTCLFSGQRFFLDMVKELISYLKSISSAPIIVGGAGFSIAPGPILEYCEADFGIWGEGEATLPLLLKSLETDRDFSEIPNLYYWNGTHLLHNPYKYYDLNTFIPQRTIIENVRYFNEGGQGNIETKRGCDQTCIYCADPLCKGSEIRLKDPKIVCAELKILLQQGIDCFHICDSEFNNPLAHAKAVCHAIIEEGLQTKIKWYPYCSPKPFDEELAELMKAAGCVGINFGVDSAANEMLQIYQRSHRSKDIARLTEICKAADLILMYDLLIGGPGETKDSIKTTLSFIKEVQPDRAGLSIGVRIYPNTELARMIQEEGPLNRNPNIYGVKTNNPSFLKPLFYLSSDIGGPAVFSYINELVGKDPMWFFANPADQNQNYNYDENKTLIRAIQKGYRGAYWDILRRLHENP